ncbi:hypothetical protein [Paenibacillus donghaensis]|nr:hypothetical protein [Paenibacillus donghaensis]
MAEDNNEPKWISLKGSVDKRSARLSQYEIPKNEIPPTKKSNQEGEKNK